MSLTSKISTTKGNKMNGKPCSNEKSKDDLDAGLLVIIILVSACVVGIFVMANAYRVEDSAIASQNSSSVTTIFAEGAKGSKPGHIDFKVLDRWGYNSAVFTDERFDGKLDYVLIVDKNGDQDIIKSNSAKVLRWDLNGALRWESWADWEERYLEVREEISQPKK